jgi:hypothetical protein
VLILDVFEKVEGIGRGLIKDTIQPLFFLENHEYGLKDPSRWPRAILYPQMLTLTSPTNGGRSVGIVRSRTQATEFSFFSVYSVVCIEQLMEIAKSVVRIVYIPSGIRTEELHVTAWSDFFDGFR